MSSPFLPTLGPLGPQTHSLGAPGGQDELSQLVSELGSDEGSFSIGAAHGGPPPEVLAQMREADEVLRRLRERGLDVRFSPGSGDEPTTIELHDSEAGTVRTLSIAEAAAIAAGGTVE
jgi:hypothetical protein